MEVNFKHSIMTAVKIHDYFQSPNRHLRATVSISKKGIKVTIPHKNGKKKISYLWQWSQIVKEHYKAEGDK